MKLNSVHIISVDPKEDWMYHAEVVKWVDGDSVWLALSKKIEIDLGFRIVQEIIPATSQNFRLAGLNTPERRGDTRVAGDKALELLKQLMSRGPLIVETAKEAGKYGRYLAHVYVDLNSEMLCVNDELLESDLAVVYGEPIPDHWHNMEP